MPPKWLVAPADAGPRCPGFELLLRRMEHVEEMRRDVSSWVGTTGKVITMELLHDALRCIT